MKKILLYLLTAFSLNCVAQFSKTHYIPPLAASSIVAAEEQYLYISTPNLAPVNFKIINIGGATINATVSRDAPYVYSIGIGNTTRLMVNSNAVHDVYNNKGYIIEADDLVYVTVRLIAGNGNQAGEIVSKGLAALGTQFRIGALQNGLVSEYNGNHLTFVSVLATENNTTVNFSDMTPGVTLINDELNEGAPFSVTLNNGQSFVMAVQGPSVLNRDGLIGMLVASDKPIAVNCGSFAGTNGEMANIDLGFDQIVSAERTGTDYIFIKSTGLSNVETVQIIAHEDDTDVFVNGNATPIANLDAGEYISMNGTSFGANGNMSVHTSKNVFAYQSIGDNGRSDQANQELFFVPPLSCETPKIIDNIPFIDEIGVRVFSGRITLVTETGSTVNFVINAIPRTLAELALVGANVVGPLTVPGNPGFETYTITGLSGNVSVYSTTQLYLASYGSSDAATFGGYYSGFTFKPEITFEQIDLTLEDCLPNIQLAVNAILGFDEFQWFYNDAPIPGANQASYTPTQPGYYHVKAGISACDTELESDHIPVSICAPDSDGDHVNDNVDIDLDNDGIVNCTESYGDVPVNLTNPLAGSVSAGNGAYTNSFTGAFPPASGLPASAPFTGNADGTFTSVVTEGKGNSMIYTIDFTQPLSFLLQYTQNTGNLDLLNAYGQFVVSVPYNRTITVLNPNNQLLIDTNFDGIYESGITEFSSFEIRFMRNGGPLLPGTGAFSFRCHLADSVTFTHINLLDTSSNRVSFRIMASCVPKDSDNDGTPDSQDLDSDNDAVPDVYESQGLNYVPLSNLDFNQDGLDNIFPANLVLADTDNDSIPDYLDLDSDNNGIYDLVESGSGAADANNNGIIDGNPASFGSNGLSNSIETSANSGLLNFTLTDSDADGVYDFAESDNDNDGCSDVREAGFADANNDGYLGNASPVVVNPNGLVTGAPNGYTTPNANYVTAAPITINAQPAVNPTVLCEQKDAVIFIDTNPEVTFQWQVSTDGTNFTNIGETVQYEGTTTNTLTIHNVTFAMDGYFYRALLNRTGNICGAISASAQLDINPIPAVVARTLVQCDTGTAPDGITIFNLSEANQSFTNGDSNLSIAYYLNASDADNNVGALGNDYTNTVNSQVLTVKVSNNTTGCYSLSTLTLSVNLLPNVTIDLPGICDELASEDGFTEFDLTTANIPTAGNQSVRYYENINDALLEQNELADPENYTNLQSYTPQILYARLESDNTNSCSRLYLINIEVYRLPDIDINDDLTPHVVCVNQPNFTTVIDASIEDGSPTTDYTYQWYVNGAPLGGETSYTLTVAAEGLYSVVVKNANGCTKTRQIPVIHSSQAIISNVETVDFVELNTITVTLDANSYGDYVYALDEQYAWQPSNVFTDVLPGVHIIYVKDKNGCDLASWEVSVMGVPKYFTPNGDGYHETWNLKGATATRNSKSVIRIFDRYGKIIKQISPLGEGWDGTYNGRAMPSDDYWYSIELEDGRSAKGHFTLKR
ncbi:MAG: T9SS type B sorting domain-containing protein [Flavobacterium sp.]|uniref:T9SS type B sorting domain-containing protein n=1 Tax=Flavobacterium sp. TaxID=239 RepID=UPI001225F4FD|nr:T9SS type B sorting domain-containing protein [Flavobacterium sp.]RZJ65778.1 MAG: T9SS type B sorting domain-containing protein [Flavobacterium sp.]